MTIFKPNGGHVGDLYNTGGCGLTGTHTFAVKIYFDTTNYDFVWHVTMDGSDIGPSWSTSYGYFARPNAGDTSELVDTSPPPAGSPFPFTEYTNALTVQWEDGTWHQAADAHAYRTSDAICPPYYLIVYHPNDFATGHDSGTIDCPATGDSLW